MLWYAGLVCHQRFCDLNEMTLFPLLFCLPVLDERFDELACSHGPQAFLFCLRFREEAMRTLGFRGLHLIFDWWIHSGRCLYTLRKGTKHPHDSGLAEDQATLDDGNSCVSL